MSRNDQTRRRRGRRGPAQRSSAIDIWRAPANLPELEPMMTPPDPSALMRSLGLPPMPDSVGAQHHFTTVVDRASVIAAALALSADLIETDD